MFLAPITAKTDALAMFVL